MDNKTVARILRETAQLLEIDGAIIGRYRTYEKAAELIEALPQPVEQMVATRRNCWSYRVSAKGWSNT